MCLVPEKRQPQAINTGSTETGKNRNKTGKWDCHISDIHIHIVCYPIIISLFKKNKLLELLVVMGFNVVG